MPYRAKPTLELFERHYIPEPNTGCWLWTGARFRKGYGNFGIDGHNRSAHRVAYELYIGPIPEGLDLDHLCRVPSCVNPDHLEPVTRRENIRRGDSVPARKAAQTHCKRGHPLFGPNLYLWKGGRICRECRAWYARGRYDPLALKQFYKAGVA
jgi:hypothetical protein